jgi:hypothetical protein
VFLPKVFKTLLADSKFSYSGIFGLFSAIKYKAWSSCSAILFCCVVVCLFCFALFVRFLFVWFFCFVYLFCYLLCLFCFVCLFACFLGFVLLLLIRHICTKICYVEIKKKGIKRNFLFQNSLLRTCFHCSRTSFVWRKKKQGKLSKKLAKLKNRNNTKNNRNFIW